MVITPQLLPANGERPLQEWNGLPVLALRASEKRKPVPCSSGRLYEIQGRTQIRLAGSPEANELQHKGVKQD